MGQLKDKIKIFGAWKEPDIAINDIGSAPYYSDIRLQFFY
jgi:hypothetical protein